MTFSQPYAMPLRFFFLTLSLQRLFAEYLAVSVRPILFRIAATQLRLGVSFGFHETGDRGLSHLALIVR